MATRNDLAHPARNLPGWELSDQRSIIRGRRYNRLKRQGARTDLTSGQTGQKLTAEILAEKHGVSEKTIRRDGKRAEAIERLAETAPDQAQASGMAE